MKRLKDIIYNCRQATFLIEKRQHVSLTLGEKTRLAIHLLGCSFCRLFQRQSILINKALRRLFATPPSPDAGLDDAFKKELQKRIEEKLK